jgi:hypothetical protein
MNASKISALPEGMDYPLNSRESEYLREAIKDVPPEELERVVADFAVKLYHGRCIDLTPETLEEALAKPHNQIGMGIIKAFFWNAGIFLIGLIGVLWLIGLV